MPLLPPEPYLFPDGLFDISKPAPSAERRWWVLHTRPRQEKSLARQMLDAQVPFYLPLISRRLPIRGRMLTSYVPLFGGYVFSWATWDERIQALATRRVVSALEVKDQEQLWQDLWQLNRLIATGAPITREDRLMPGDTVEIRSGPLAGLRGKVIRAATGKRFVIQVNFIQQGASVLMDGFNLLATVEDE